MINSRLFEWYGIDTTKNLQFPKICPRPFDTVLIDKMGSCYLCQCTAWLPQSAGNLFSESLPEILNSPTAQLLQESILDRSYRYCNDKQCTFLKNTIKKRHHPVPPKQIKHIRLAIDNSCNLSCPSCRTEQIFFKSGKQLKMRLELANKILDFVKKQDQTVRIHIGSDGDPFASLVYRYFIQQSKDLDNVRFTVQTNGLLVKKMYRRFQSLFDKLDILNISIDGATKPTYEKLRRGGQFENIISNLDFLSNIDRKFQVQLHMVVQQDNWQEMPKMLELGKKYKVDRIYFNKIENWNTGLDFSKQTFTEEKGFKDIVKQMTPDPIAYVLSLL